MSFAALVITGLGVNATIVARLCLSTAGHDGIAFTATIIFRFRLATARDWMSLAALVIFRFRLAFRERAGYGEGSCCQAQADRQHSLVQHFNVLFS
jgi:hypothetical protein